MNSEEPDTIELAFAFAFAYRLPALLFGITPATTGVRIGPDELQVRFGPWRLRTPRSNIAGSEESGGFSFLKTAGPAHLSLVDHGVTFATNADRAVCVRFHQPVKAIEPSGRLLHPAVTLTVADPAALISALHDRR